jgi:uncharacterized membrane protein
MHFTRVLRHLSSTPWGLRRAFDDQTLNAIEGSIARSERVHGGEIRVAIEGHFGARELMRRVTARERALQVFAQLGVWDTEANNGVLIYVLWADHDVEIVADRGFNAGVSAQEWRAVCRRMEQLFANGDNRRALTEGIREVGELIARHYPSLDRNELPDRPIVL